MLKWQVRLAEASLGGIEFLLSQKLFWKNFHYENGFISGFQETFR